MDEGGGSSRWTNAAWWWVHSPEPAAGEVEDDGARGGRALSLSVAAKELASAPRDRGVLVFIAETEGKSFFFSLFFFFFKHFLFPYYFLSKNGRLRTKYKPNTTRPISSVALARDKLSSAAQAVDSY